MVKLSELVGFLDEYLGINRDYGDAVLNGLVVEACDLEKNVEVVCLACDVNKKVIEEVAKRNASLLITHHGIFTKHDEAKLVGLKGKLVRMLVKNGISLYVAHLPLDFHEEIGNHVALARALNFRNFRIVELKKGDKDYGSAVVVELENGMNAEDFARFLAEKLDVSIDFQPAGGKVRNVAIVTGSSMSMLEDVLKAADVDSFLCGEAKHAYIYHAEQLGVNVFYATHYRTEIFGLKELANKLENTFKGLGVVFIDIPPSIKRVER